MKETIIMIINNATVEQINIALLDIDKKLKTTSVTFAQVQQIQKQLDNVQRTLKETSIGLSSGATYNISITGNASSATYAVEAGSAKVTATAQSAEIANYANTAGSATTATSATTAQSAESADEAGHAVTADNISAGGTSGQVLTSNGPSAAPSWQDQKLKTVKFADYRTESLTFNSLAEQKKIELSNFGPDVTEDNVLSFMVIYCSGVPIIAQGDYAKSQGTGSSGLACVLNSLNVGTGWCVIRCVYLA